MKKMGVIVLTLSLLFTCSAWSADKGLEASLEMERVSVGNPVYLYLTFHGAQGVDAPNLPEINGLRIKYVGPSTKVSVVNGRVSQSVTHTYLVMPLKGGQYTIGPFSVDSGGRTYTAPAVTLVTSGRPVRPTPSSRAPSSSSPSSATVSPRQQAEQSEVYDSDKVFLKINIPRKTLYVNEMVPLTIKIYVHDTGLKDISFPTYPHEGFSIGEFTEPKRTSESRAGYRYDVLEFRQEIFGIKEGDFVLGPASLNCKMMVAKKRPRRSSMWGRSVFDDDFFSHRVGFTSYPIELRSEEIPVTILSFPKEGRPESFKGAVGDFAMDVSVSPKKVKVGDPLELKMNIRGLGNLDTVTAPYVDAGEGFKTYEPQVTKKGTEKTYEQIFIPKNTEVKQVPAVTFSYFDPKGKKYKTITKGPFPVTVIERPASEQGVKVVTTAGEGQVVYPKEKLGQDIIYIKDSRGKRVSGRTPLYANVIFLAGQIIPLVLFLGFFAAFRKKERIMTDRTYARSLRAPRKAQKGLAKAKACIGKEDPVQFYDAIFHMLQEYLGDRFDLPKGSVSVEAVEAKLHASGGDGEVVDALRDIFSRCEMARYASTAVKGAETEEEVLNKVKTMIDKLERAKG